ncbi:unnamed protein product [Cylicostephanus goldi]|uniref:Uncharacterized protein n=1 Tax=Cylicostephanus goldi TaxID=71465 RepID=A0A3P6SG49_CYLGO|nr:unnamed protein product [Cylicostephanus goldi]
MDSLDFLTVRGAGHFVSSTNEKPKEALQLFVNYLRGTNYSTPIAGPSTVTSTISTIVTASTTSSTEVTLTSATKTNNISSIPSFPPSSLTTPPIQPTTTSESTTTSTGYVFAANHAAIKKGKLTDAFIRLKIVSRAKKKTKRILCYLEGIAPGLSEGICPKSEKLRILEVFGT